MKRISILKRVAYAFLVGYLSSSFVGCGNGKQATPETSNTGNQVSQSSSGQEGVSSGADQISTAREQSVTDEISQTGSPVEQSASNASANVKEPLQADIKGVWYGEAVYDIDAVNARIDKLDPEQANKLQEMVNTFSSIVMAAEFRPDAVMEMDMMITTSDGQQLRDRAVGTWSIVEKTPTGLKIATSEYKDQSQEPVANTYIYQFIDKDRFQFVPDSVSSDLREFSPRIVFQRVEQPLDDAAVAEEKDGKVVR